MNEGERYSIERLGFHPTPGETLAWIKSCSAEDVVNELIYRLNLLEPEDECRVLQVFLDRARTDDGAMRDAYMAFIVPAAHSCVHFHRELKNGQTSTGLGVEAFRGEFDRRRKGERE